MIKWYTRSKYNYTELYRWYTSFKHYILDMIFSHLLGSGMKGSLLSSSDDPSPSSSSSFSDSELLKSSELLISE